MHTVPWWCESWAEKQRGFWFRLCSWGLLFSVLWVFVLCSAVPLQALHSCLVLWDTDSVPGCVQIQDTLISAGLWCIHTLQSSQRAGKSHWSHWSWCRVGTVGLSESWLCELRVALHSECHYWHLVQLTAVLCYKVDWFFNSLKDIWGTTLLIVTLTTQNTGNTAVIMLHMHVLCNLF